MKKLLCIVFSLILSISALSGCSNDTNSGDDTIKETNEYIVKNSTTEYALVVDNVSDSMLDFAIQEFKLFFEEATDIVIPVVYAGTVSYSEEAKYVSLGKNALFLDAGLSTDDMNLGMSGYTIQTKGNSVFIAGENYEATLFGVYEFFSIMFNFDCFSNTYYYIDTGITEAKLKALSVVDVPDTQFRAIAAPMIAGDTTASARMRMNCISSGGKLLGHQTVHSGMLYLPKEEYQANHPKWYAASGSQLCFTAGGDPNEYAIMVDTLFAKMRDFAIEDQEGFIYNFGIEDLFGFCECDECKRIKAVYGCMTAGLIRLLNDVAVKLDAWMESDDGQPYARDYRIKLLAYYDCVYPPAKYNSQSGEWEPVDNSSYSICHDRVVPHFAAIRENFSKSIFAPENKATYEQLLGWRACAKELGFWGYSCDYNNYLVYSDLSNYKYGMLKLLSETGGLYYFNEEGRACAGAAPGWDTLQNYLVSKLSWDGSADVDALTQKFIKYYYGDGAKAIGEYYDLYRTQTKYAYMNEERGFYYYTDLNTAENYPKSYLDQSLVFINEALKEIEYLKSVNPALYQTYYNNITLERITVYYLMIKLFESSYTESETYQMKLSLKEDCNRMGVGKINHNTAVDTLFNQWGV